MALHMQPDETRRVYSNAKNSCYKKLLNLNLKLSADYYLMILVISTYLD